MDDYEVIEHRQKSNGDAKKEGNENGNGNGKTYVVKAINFVVPTCITFTTAADFQFDAKVQAADGKEVYSGGNAIGEIIKRQDSKDVTVNTDYDIKYTGGYSKDGKIIYMDKDFPKALVVEGINVDLIQSIALHHELVEKWLIDDAYDYQYAHTIATKIEKEYVASINIKWDAYDSEVGKELKRVYDKKLAKSPRNLDLSPYIATNDQAALTEIRESLEL
ncbi:MAG: hypothetical protein QXR73_02665 [Candidatus Micrarchaeaceae archaeon]